MTNEKKKVSASKKGREFENAVAKLFRLLGANVVQNVEICQKNVDILATFSHPVAHRVIVECKDEKTSKSDIARVLEFHGLLEFARRSDQAESAEIITRVPMSDEAKGFALQAGLTLLTYNEKLARLLDFRSYLDRIVQSFDAGDPSRSGDPPLRSYWIDLKGTEYKKDMEQEIDDLSSHILRRVLEKERKRPVAVFGEYGSGKSSFCQKLARDLAAGYLNDPALSRIPILMNLRNFVDKFDIEAFVTSFLDRECDVSNPRYQIFREMNDAGLFVIILDGLDEMTTRVSSDTLESNLLEIGKLAGSRNGRIVLTGRAEHFISQDEESHVLNKQATLMNTRSIEYDLVRIKPWDDSEVEEFLKKRVPLIKKSYRKWTHYRDRIKEIPGLSDLSQRPILLEMIVKTLPKLVVDGRKIDRPSIYRTYLTEEIKRQKVSKKRSFVLTDDQRMTLLKTLATEVCIEGVKPITFGEAVTLVEKVLKPERHELDSYTRDFLTNSFLTRRGDEFQFSHGSFLEYLAATSFFEEIVAGKPVLFGKSRMDPAVSRFIAEMKPNLQTLRNWIDANKEIDNNSPFVGGNAASILNHLGTRYAPELNLSGKNLTGTMLSGADLQKNTLERTILADAVLTDVSFSRETLATAQLARTTFSFRINGNRMRVGYSGNQLFISLESIANRYPNLKLLRLYQSQTDKDRLIFRGLMQISDLEDFESFRSTVETFLNLRIAFYSEEYVQE